MDQQQFAPVYSLLESAVAEGVFPGCAFGVLNGRGDTWTGAVGRQTYDADAPPIEPATLYDLASVTKVAATTAMAMLLHQRGLLTLDQPVVDWLPEFALGSAERALVTFRHLLGHCSGLAGYARLFENCSTADSLWQACIAMPLEVLPGTRVEYSDIGFILLGGLLERIAREPLDLFCRREVFTPLDMGSAHFRPALEQRQFIPPTENDTAFRHRVIQGEVQDENCWVLGGVSGHAGLFGNVRDLLHFAEALLFPAKRLLFHEEQLSLFAARTNLPPGSSRALGWDTPSAPSSSGSMFSTNSIGHLGYAGTSLWIDLDEPCAVVLLTNRTWPTRENQRIKQLRPAFHNAVRDSLVRTSTS